MVEGEPRTFPRSRHLRCQRECGAGVSGGSVSAESCLALFPLVCENGWRCCLINRDRKMPTDYIRNGVLYVTEK